MGMNSVPNRQVAFFAVSVSIICDEPKEKATKWIRTPGYNPNSRWTLRDRGIPIGSSLSCTEKTITMKGPWESIACGREKGFKTQKLEKQERHSRKRVSGQRNPIIVIGRYQESEGCTWTHWWGRWTHSLWEAHDGYFEGLVCMFCVRYRLEATTLRRRCTSSQRTEWVEAVDFDM